jgi:hypothetical protein
MNGPGHAALPEVVDQRRQLAEYVDFENDERSEARFTAVPERKAQEAAGSEGEFHAGPAQECGNRQARLA